MIEWNEPKRGGRAGSSAYMAISVITSGNSKHASRLNQLVLRFGPDASKDLRMIIGDRLIIGIDKITKEVCFKRTTGNNGYKLTGKSGKSLTVQASMDLKVMSVQTIDISSIKIESTHIAIRCPALF